MNFTVMSHRRRHCFRFWVHVVLGLYGRPQACARGTPSRVQGLLSFRPPH